MISPWWVKMEFDDRLPIVCMLIVLSVNEEQKLQKAHWASFCHDITYENTQKNKKDHNKTSQITAVLLIHSRNLSGVSWRASYLAG